MTDRVHPSSKPATATATATTTADNPRSFPPTKAQLYNPNRHPYRPQPTTQKPPHHHNRRRRCHCSLCKCCFCTLLIIATIILLAAAAAAVAYLLYNPHRPTFSISALKLTQFNLTTATADDSTHLTTKLNITLSSKNPNKKAIFFYDPISISTQINQIQIANGSFQSFISNPNNITIIHSTLYSNSQVLDADSATVLRSELRKKTKLPLKILLDTQVRVKMESHKSKKVGIRITCEGVKVEIQKGKKSSPSVATISDPKCKVDLRITIWKFSF